MKISNLTSITVVTGFLILAAGRLAMAQSAFCPDIIRQNCLPCAKIATGPNSFSCCASGGNTPGGNPICCSYSCREYKCVPTIVGTESCIGISHKVDATNGTPSSPEQCKQLSWGQACVADDEDTPPGEG